MDLVKLNLKKSVYCMIEGDEKKNILLLPKMGCQSTLKIVSSFIEHLNLPSI